MKRQRSVSRRQFALGFECQTKHQPPAKVHEELLEALADFLLEALGEEVDEPASEQGGGNEPEDHP